MNYFMEQLEDICLTDLNWREARAARGKIEQILLDMEASRARNWESVLDHARAVRRYFMDTSSDPYQYHSKAMLSLDYIIGLAVIDGGARPDGKEAV